MRRILLGLLAALTALVLLVACNNKEEPATSSSSETPAGSSLNENTSSEQPADEVDEQRLQDIYEELAEAAGLSGTIEETKTDLNAGGGISVDNILGMVGQRSIVGGDSGLVLVLQVAPGTADELVKELEAYRASYIDGPAYEEFADSQEAMSNARIEAHGDIVVYVSVSTAAGASYDDVDAALARIFA